MSNEREELLQEQQALRDSEPQRVEDGVLEQREPPGHEAQLAAIGRFSASLAHDLRNPLGVIRNAAFFLKRQIPPEYPKWAQYINVIEQQTAAASQIITDMAAIGRCDPPDRQPVALGAVLEAARSSLGPAEDIQWQFVFQPDPLVLDIDAAQWERVFRNLFRNSLWAMGGAGRITVEAVRGDAHDEIFVADSGPGVPAEIRARIFEPFFSGKGKGAGLGLSTCRQVIQRHGGDIELVDAPQGARFRIRLPRK